MFQKRFLQILAASSIVFVSLTISSFTMINSPLRQGTTGSFYQQHQASIVAAQVSPKYHLDCFRRHYNFSQTENTTPEQQDASNYYLTLS